MSDPVKNSDIEDVLSSIRRLVSDEPKARPTPEKDELEKVERLVLTPAFRVSEEAPAEPAEHDDESNPPNQTLEEASEQSSEEWSPYAEHQETTDAQDEHAQPSDLYEETPDVDRPEPEIDSGYEPTEDWDDPKLTNPQPANTNDERRDHDDSEEQASDDSGWAQETEEAASHSDQSPNDASSETSLESRIAELEAALQNSAQDWEPDGSEEVLDDETTPISAAVETPDVDLSTVLDGAIMDAVAQTVEEDVAEALTLHSSDSVNEVTEEGDHADENASQVTATENSDDTVYVLQTARVDDTEAEHETDHENESWNATQDETDTQETENAADPNAPDADHAADYQTVEENHAEAPETLDENTAEALDWVDNDVAVETQWQDDEPVEDAQAEDHSNDAEPVLDQVAENADELELPELQAESVSSTQDTQDSEVPLGAAPSEKDADPISNILADDDATIDEETLREMISELVRQELQGALGERITRNVRRLVRREIQRAMAMRDLE